MANDFATLHITLEASGLYSHTKSFTQLLSETYGIMSLAMRIITYTYQMLC